jgi:hypothetical protein
MEVTAHGLHVRPPLGKGAESYNPSNSAVER